MYGLIHTALRDMVIETYGPEKWDKVVTKSGVTADTFLSMRSYDDSVAYNLVGSTAQVLECSAESCLREFGHYWLTQAAPKVYASLLDTTGDTLFEFLESLDDLHDKITLTFIDYSPPSFRLERLSDHHARLHYRSQRQGLTPFVSGLIKGMEQRFNVSINVESTEEVAVSEGEYTIFEITVSQSHETS